MVASDSPLVCTYIAAMPLASSLYHINHSIAKWL